MYSFTITCYSRDCLDMILDEFQHGTIREVLLECLSEYAESKNVSMAFYPVLNEINEVIGIHIAKGRQDVE